MNPAPIFIEDRPLIDVRAPIEFARGAFPCATNLPILTDTEREQVGICYKESGQEAAVTLGQRLVSNETRRQRLDLWQDYLAQHPTAMLYCFRGGQRSEVACAWLQAEGFDVPRIQGGYKRLRSYLLGLLEKLPALVIISGRTGTGKTDLLANFAQSIDLEALANHRGSAFGGRVTPQPSQIDFENAVAIRFLKQASEAEILLEDEGRMIGRLQLPLPLQQKMRESPVLVIEEPLAARVERIFDEYIQAQWSEYVNIYGRDAGREFGQYLLTAVDAIRKRLGNVAHEDTRRNIVAALAMQERAGRLDGHRQWITTLLLHYYDPMYDYQLEKKAGRVRIRGPGDVVAGWYARHQACIE